MENGIIISHIWIKKGDKVNIFDQALATLLYSANFLNILFPPLFFIHSHKMKNAFQKSDNKEKGQEYFHFLLQKLTQNASKPDQNW